MYYKVVAGSIAGDDADSDDNEYTRPSTDVDLSEYRSQPLNTITDKELQRLKLGHSLFMTTETGQRMDEVRRSLPMWKYKTELLDLIRKNQVVIVSGETGCGKTTQLPQFILEEAISSGSIANTTNIICTQPRRISAMSVSKRVADERGEVLGDMVGFQIRMMSQKSTNTRLLFCTSGVLLRKLIHDRGLENVSHVIVDEIHERGMNEDFLLIILRNLLSERPDLRVILMSATLDAKTFSEYFSNAPTVHVPGFMHPVREYFLEDVLESTGPWRQYWARRRMLLF